MKKILLIAALIAASLSASAQLSLSTTEAIDAYRAILSNDTNKLPVVDIINNTSEQQEVRLGWVATVPDGCSYFQETCHEYLNVPGGTNLTVTPDADFFFPSTYDPAVAGQSLLLLYIAQSLVIPDPVAEDPGWFSSYWLAWDLAGEGVTCTYTSYVDCNGVFHLVLTFDYDE